MADLIDRQAAIDAVNEYLRISEVSKTVQNMTSIQAILKWLPSAQPEIIRCKDCRHNGSFDTDCPIDWKGKEYCSFAER